MPTAFVTVPPSEAESIAQTLVEERLAACVNRLSCTSTYRWEGQIEVDAEAVLLAKTTDRRYDDLVERVLELHPYEVPCVERYDATDAHDPFEAWIAESVD